MECRDQRVDPVAGMLFTGAIRPALQPVRRAALTDDRSPLALHDNHARSLRAAIYACIERHASLHFQHDFDIRRMARGCAVKRFNAVGEFIGVADQRLYPQLAAA